MEFQKTSLPYVGSFGWCTSLTTIAIGHDVTNIGNYAFAWSEKLTNFYFHGTKEPTYVSQVFMDCSSLKTIYVPTNYEDDDLTKFCGYTKTISNTLQKTDWFVTSTNELIIYDERAFVYDENEQFPWERYKETIN